MSAGIAVAVAVLVGLYLFMLERQRAMAEAAAQEAAAHANLLRAQEAGGREHQAIMEVKQPRWEYRVLAITGNDDAVNRAIGKLTEDRWEYVGVVPPGSATVGGLARMIFKRVKR
jgi:hypothetical protein